MMSVSFNDCDHGALFLEAAMVLGDNPTPPCSPAPSNTVGKTPTIDYCPADLAATVDGCTGALHTQLGLCIDSILGLCADSILGKKIHTQTVF